MTNPDWIESVAWNADGLAPVVAQDAASGEVLMLAWMNREALRRTVASGEAVYWSRSRKALWKKARPRDIRSAWSRSGSIATPTPCCCASNP